MTLGLDQKTLVDSDRESASHFCPLWAKKTQRSERNQAETVTSPRQLKPEKTAVMMEMIGF